MTLAVPEQPQPGQSEYPLQAPRGVAFLCHPYHRGGVTRWMADAAVEFARRGVTTWFVTPEPTRPFKSGGGQPSMASLLREAERGYGVRLAAPPVDKTFELGMRRYRRAVYANALAAHVRPGTPVIVSDDDDVWAAASSLGDAFPIIGVLHGDDSKYYRLAGTYASRLAACVAVSKRVALKAQPLTKSPIQTVPCGVPLAPEVLYDHSPEMLGRLLWVGRLEEESKRVSDLPIIAARLRENDVPFLLEIVGDGPSRRSLQTQVDHLGLQSVVLFSGWLPNHAVLERMKASDVLLLPSNHEGMPVVVMEALASGCAVVASRVSGVEDAAEEPIASKVLLLHEVGDTDSAVTQVAHALAIPKQERRRMARNAAKQLFSIETCVDRYSEIVARAQAAVSTVPMLRSAAFNRLISLPLAHARDLRRAMMRQPNTSGH